MRPAESCNPGRKAENAGLRAGNPDRGFERYKYSGFSTEAPAGAEEARFIVQVGAFADDGAVRDVQQRAEKAGVKTYTQVVNTSAGKRTRVRVGPFSSRAEAEKAAATLKKAGLAGSILPL